MKSEKLFTAIGGIDERFIDEEAEFITREAKAHTTSVTRHALWVKWTVPVAACLAVVITVMLTANNRLPSLIQKNEEDSMPNYEQGIVISGSFKDSFDVNLESAEQTPQLISDNLKKAMDSAGSGDKIRTMVLVPGFEGFLDSFQENGVCYRELREQYESGSFKLDANGVSGVTLLNAMATMRESARSEFFNEVTAEFGIIGAERAIISTDYNINSYTFMANLSVAEINRLAEKSCRMWLGMQKALEGYSDIITERLINELQVSNGTDAIEVLIVLAIDTNSFPQFDPAFYEGRIVRISGDNASEEYIRSIVDGVKSDYQLTPFEEQIDLITIGDKESPAVTAHLICMLTSEQVIALSKDERIRTLSPNDCEPQSVFDEATD